METNEKKVMDAIETSTLKVSYKMKRALLRIAKRKTPIDRIYFCIRFK